MQACVCDMCVCVICMCVMQVGRQMQAEYEAALHAVREELDVARRHLESSRVSSRQLKAKLGAARGEIATREEMHSSRVAEIANASGVQRHSMGMRIESLRQELERLEAVRARARVHVCMCAGDA